MTELHPADADCFAVANWHAEEENREACGDWWEAMDMRQEQERDDDEPEANQVLRACHRRDSVAALAERGALIRSWCKETAKCPTDKFHACERTEERIMRCMKEDPCPSSFSG